MECQNTIKNLKFNKNKSIGEVILIVEGEVEEFRLFKHIFTNVLDYNYTELKRGKILKECYQSKSSNNNTITIANTSSSTIDSILKDINKVYNLLQSEYNRSLKNARIYIIWDRDSETNKSSDVLESLNTFSNSMDNSYEMNGLLLLSYPCIESYELSNFIKNEYKNTYSKSSYAKKKMRESQFKIKDINEKTILLAAYNMHKAMYSLGIINYNPDMFKDINKKIFRKEEEYNKKFEFFKSLSLISIMFVDLGIIEEKFDN